MRNIIILMSLLFSVSNSYAESNKNDLQALKKNIQLLNNINKEPINLHTYNVPYVYNISVEKENIDDKNKPLAIYNYSGRGLLEYKPSSVWGGSSKNISYIKECHRNNENKIFTCYGGNINTGVNYSINSRNVGENNYEINFNFQLNDLLNIKEDKTDDFILKQAEFNTISIDNIITYNLVKKTYVFNASNSNHLNQDHYIITLTLEPIQK